MAKGYVIAHVKLHDKEQFAEFAEMAGLVICEYGGTVLDRNSTPEIREGRKSGIAIVIDFESIERARNFYESEKYAEAKAVRELASESNLILVEGL